MAHTPGMRAEMRFASRRAVPVLCALALAALLCGFDHPWLSAQADTQAGTSQSLQQRFTPPPGSSRVAAAAGSFAAWLRTLPILPGRPLVRLHDGTLKGNQGAHVAIIDIDVGKRDLQQCADASIRLRAEYLWSARQQGAVCFVAAAGYHLPWKKWSAGMRPPQVRGGPWQRSARPGHGYRSFRRYLDRVFGVANTASIMRQMTPVERAEVRAGDVFIEGATSTGYGHAVTVMDVVQDAAGDRRLLLSQSFMPAQQMHVLRGPGGVDDPWYPVPAAGQPLETPEWSFPPGSLHRFDDRRCR